jgi:four helix bundle protein
MQPYERFEAWKLAHQFAVDVYALTKTWPKDERYGLVSQVRRSSFSVAVNIVEGSGRKGRREFARFLDIAFASMLEAGYTLRFARDVGILTPEQHDLLDGKRQQASKTLYLLLKSMRV